MQQCTRCHKAKPLEQFVKTDGGHFKLCQACRQYRTSWNHAHPESVKKAQLKYNKSDKGKACRKHYAQTDKARKAASRRVMKYHATEKGRATKRRAAKKYNASEKGQATALAYRQGPGREKAKRRREKYPQRYRARCAVNDAIRRGHIKKPSLCQICDQPAKLQGHHYAGWEEERKLDVWWLCQSCHRGNLPHDNSLTLNQAQQFLTSTDLD